LDAFEKNKDGNNLTILILLKWFKLFPFAKKLPFFIHFLPFSPSIALLCNSKKPSNGQKISNFR